MPSDHPLVPTHKQDLARAEAAVAAGLPAVLPVLGNLLEWLQDYNWPVAHVLAPFLGTVGVVVVPHVKRVLGSDDNVWKYWVLSCVVAPQPEVLSAIRSELERIVHTPAEGERREGVVELAEELLSAGCGPTKG